MIKVEVTKDDIINGEPGNPAKCPIALAITRMFNISHICVMRSGGCMLLETEIGCMLLLLQFSRSARRAISKFDRSTPIKPFTFLLHIEGTTAIRD